MYVHIQPNDNGWGIYDKEVLFFVRKNSGLLGSTLSGHRMTTSFDPFELPTHGLLQKGRDWRLMGQD